MTSKICHYCLSKLDRDTVGLNKKLLGRQTKQFLCLKCLQGYLEVTEEELLEKIQYYKDQGCTLFV